MQLNLLAIGCVDHDHPRRREVLLEFWRLSNLFHLTTYCLADKSRLLYSFDNFLLPVSGAFGEHDGEDRMGMMLRAEKDALKGHSRRQSILDGLPLFMERLGDTHHASAKLHDALVTKLFHLSGQCVNRKMCSAAFPVWAGSINNLTAAAARVVEAGLYRSPRIYRDLTLLIVQGAVLFDTLSLAATLGETFSFGREEGSGVFHTMLLAILVCLLEVCLATGVLMMVHICHSMEIPFGDNEINMTGLNYVATCAYRSLELIVPREANRSSQLEYDDLASLAAINITHVFGEKDANRADDEAELEAEEDCDMDV